MTRKTYLQGAAIVGALMIGLGGAVYAAGGKHGDRGMFNRLDANGDKQITAEEVTELVGKKFSRYDADGDGKVTAEEIDAQLQKWVERRRQRMLERLDTDGDGMISQAEFEAPASARFARMDVDGDGVVTRDDMRQYRKEMRSERREKRREKRKQRR